MRGHDRRRAKLVEPREARLGSQRLGQKRRHRGRRHGHDHRIRGDEWATLDPHSRRAVGGDRDLSHRAVRSRSFRRRSRSCERPARRRARKGRRAETRCATPRRGRKRPAATLRRRGPPRRAREARSIRRWRAGSRSRFAGSSFWPAAASACDTVAARSSAVCERDAHPAEQQPEPVARREMRIAQGAERQVQGARRRRAAEGGHHRDPGGRTARSVAAESRCGPRRRCVAESRAWRRSIPSTGAGRCRPRARLRVLRYE